MTISRGRDTVELSDLKIFDFDNHYYEAEDAFTRYEDKALRGRGVAWGEIKGRRRLIVGGKVNSYVANPTFDPVAKPGSLYEWYRGNPKRVEIVEAFGELEPIRAEYRDRDARLAVMDEQGVAAALLFPTLAVGMEDALKDDTEACYSVHRAFNRWLVDDWGFNYRNRLFAVPCIPMLDPAAAAAELQAVLDTGAVTVNVRGGPVPVAGGYRSPFDPAYDGFWGLVAEAGIPVTTHAGIDGYDAIVQMWEPGVAESAFFRSPMRGLVTKGRAISDFLAAAICHGLFERFPAVRLGVVENGASWAPDLLHRLDGAAAQSPRAFRESPRETFAQHIWVTPFWEDDIGVLSEDIGVERLLLGSDWPHAEGMREPIDFVEESLTGFGSEELQRIARDNALELLQVALGD